MLVTLVRHGQSLSNAGVTEELDSDLTELGSEQAKATAQRIVSEGIDAEITTILVSPFIRTVQTCRPLAVLSELTAELFPEICEYFSDMDDRFVTLRGQDLADLRLRWPFLLAPHVTQASSNWWPAIREDRSAIFERATRVRATLLERFSPDAAVFIFSHAEPIGRMIESFTCAQPNPDRPPWTGNCSLTRIRMDNPAKPGELLFLNDTTHLARRGLESPS